MKGVITTLQNVLASYKMFRNEDHCLIMVLCCQEWKHLSRVFNKLRGTTRYLFAHLINVTITCNLFAATFCEEVTCYLFMRAKLKWKEAQTECEMKHGKLVSIKSDAIQKLIEKELRIYKITDPMWIGASIINEIAFTNQSVSLWRVVQGKLLIAKNIDVQTVV